MCVCVCGCVCTLLYLSTATTKNVTDFTPVSYSHSLLTAIMRVVYMCVFCDDAHDNMTFHYQFAFEEVEGGGELMMTELF